MQVGVTGASGHIGSAIVPGPIRDLGPGHHITH